MRFTSAKQSKTTLGCKSFFFHNLRLILCFNYLSLQANIKIMFENFGFALVLIAAGLAFLAVKLFFGKKFVHTHLEGNKALNKKGILA